MGYNIIVNIGTSSKEKEKFERKFLESKIKTQELTRRDLFKAFVLKFSENPTETMKFLNL